ncbi:hypothetical protein [Agromyces sp. NPDC058104]|uniref:hypothetical protein n=1 Tax=Agromyces sp. NPDC058104 TaxID=3346342 RepID=UPI0036DD1BB9
MFELRLLSYAEVRTTEHLRISAEEIRHFDGYCGIGVRIENVSTTPVQFTPNDLSVFIGAHPIEWDLPFSSDSETTKYRGYVIGEFPEVLEPGETASDAFVVYCKEGGAFTIQVASLDGDSATFDFPT